MIGSSRDDHEKEGALFCRIRGIDVVRHYGDPMGEYQAAVSSDAMRDRGHRSRFLITGKNPVDTLNGTLTGRMPSPPAGSYKNGAIGRAEYSAVLTPKGRVVTDLRVMWGVDPEEESLWLDVPAPGAGPMLEHLKRYVPPRLATVNDVSEDVGIITVLGPMAGEALEKISFISAETKVVLDSLAENEYLIVGKEGERIVRNPAVNTPAWDIFTSKEGSRKLWTKFLSQGIKPMGVSVWDTLRIEAGRPAFGQDMDESKMLPETSIVDIAVDHSKGCYTGQEVIVRIRDRGHVNKSLRGLYLGDGPAPRSNAEIFYEGNNVGHITSVADSPRYGGRIALGYIRREVSLGEAVTIGSPDGAQAVVRELGSEWAAF